MRRCYIWIVGGKNMKLLISEREEESSDSLEREYLSFFMKHGFDVIPVPNNTKNLESLLPMADRIVLTGGGNVGEQKIRDEVEKKMLDFSQENNIPILGICRGFQFINSYFGGELQHIEKHVGITHVIAINDLFENMNIVVNSYHDYGIKHLGKGLNVFATSIDGIIEGIYNDNIIAVQWHPERDNDISFYLDDQIIELFKSRGRRD